MLLLSREKTQKKNKTERQTTAQIGTTLFAKRKRRRRRKGASLLPRSCISFLCIFASRNRRERRETKKKFCFLCKVFSLRKIGNPKYIFFFLPLSFLSSFVTVERNFFSSDARERNSEKAIEKKAEDHRANNVVRKTYHLPCCS